MTKKLLVVFASGLVLAIVLIAAAWAIGGQRFMSDIQKNGGWTFVDTDDDTSGPRASKTLAYDGTQPLTLDAPVSMKFVRGTANRITVEGRREMIEAVRWEGGRLYLADDHPKVQHALNVTVVSQQIPGVVLKGAGDVQLTGLAQPTLAVDLTGAGNITGSGKVDTLTITGQGAGNLDFAKLDARDATVKASGVGNVEIAATGRVDVTLAGAGNISLHKKPAQLTTSVTGIGSIEHDY